MNNGTTNISVRDTNSDNIGNSDNMLLPINYGSYKPWIRALYDRALDIYSNINLLQKQVALIKKVISWNGYPRYALNKIIKRLENWISNKNNNTLVQQDIVTVFAEFFINHLLNSRILNPTYIGLFRVNTDFI